MCPWGKYFEQHLYLSSLDLPAFSPQPYSSSVFNSYLPGLEGRWTHPSLRHESDLIRTRVVPRISTGKGDKRPDAPGYARRVTKSTANEGVGPLPLKALGFGPGRQAIHSGWWDRRRLPWVFRGKRLCSFSRTTGRNSPSPLCLCALSPAPLHVLPTRRAEEDCTLRVSSTEVNIQKQLPKKNGLLLRTITWVEWNLPSDWRSGPFILNMRLGEGVAVQPAEARELT